MHCWLEGDWGKQIPGLHLGDLETQSLGIFSQQGAQKVLGNQKWKNREIQGSVLISVQLMNWQNLSESAFEELWNLVKNFKQGKLGEGTAALW